jgi:hypothetical protein
MGKAWQNTNQNRLRGRAAQERRKRILAAHPLCARCEERGITRLAEELDPPHSAESRRLGH